MADLFVFDPFTNEPRKLVAGSNVTFDVSVAGQLTVSSTGGSGSPGGADTQVQFNDAGSFGGDSGLTYDKTNNRLIIGSETVFTGKLEINPEGMTTAFGYGIIVAGNFSGSATEQIGIGVSVKLTADSSKFYGILSFAELDTNVDLGTWYGLFVYDVSLNAGATLQNDYGIFVRDIVNGVNNYAWWSGLGESRFGDTVEIEANLEVTGQTVFNTVPYTWPASDGTSGFVLSTNGAGTLAWAAGSGAVEVAYNYLVNGGGDFFQRQDPATLTSKADDVYAGDRWYVLTQTTTIQTQRTTGDTHSPKAHRLKQDQASAQRMGYAQIIESPNSIPLRSRAVRFQARINCSASQAIRIAILEWTGTADAVTSDVVNDWTNGTFTAGQFFNSTTLTVTAVSSVTPSAATWTDISVTGTLGASVNNIIVLIWTEGTAAQNVTLDITEAGFYAGTSAQSWSPRLIEHELLMAQRHYMKSFSLDTAPAQNSGVVPGLLGYTVIVAGVSNGRCQLIFPSVMFATPTIVTYNISAANDKWRNTTVGADSGTPIVNVSSHRSVIIENPQVIGDLVGNGCFVHWSAEAEL